MTTKLISSNSHLIENKKNHLQAKVLAQGAEAIITLVKADKKSRTSHEKDLTNYQKISGDERERFNERSEEQFIVKERIVKGYRLPALDEQIRKSRTKKEAKILIKAKEAGVNVPKVLNVDKKGEPKDKFNLEIEFIEGDKLSQTLNDYKKDKQEKVMELLGKQVAKLHEKDLIHGDLTTSNVIFSDDRIYIIDFGLGFISKRLEDKAVDLHLIKQALEAKHWQNWEDLFEHFSKGYKWEDSEKVLEQLKKVEARGRYRH